MSVTAADFNGDQVADLAVANEAAYRMTIMLNEIVPAGRVVQLASDQDLGDQNFGFSLLVPGDTNADYVVNVQDLNAVRNNFGSSGDNVGGDANLDWRVDIKDLNLVRNNFGASQSSTPAATTPPPIVAPSATVERSRAMAHDGQARRATPALIDLRAADVLFGRMLDVLAEVRRDKSSRRR
ncbi:MAG: hypothetical protein SGJ19_11895 [Planctomycetia bacterium]|nr:hypothetical protein [Planctomycetia bacterium]